MYTYSLILYIQDIVGLIKAGFPTLDACMSYGTTLEHSNILVGNYLMECIPELWV